MNAEPWVKSYPPACAGTRRSTSHPCRACSTAAAARFGPLPALQFMDKRITYSELEALANRAAKGFQKLGVGPGVHDMGAQPHGRGAR